MAPVCLIFHLCLRQRNQMMVSLCTPRGWNLLPPVLSTNMVSPSAPPDLTAPPAVRRAAFTLVELLVVMAIIILMTALVVPAFTSMRAGADFISVANDIGNTIEQARAYAMANNTYVYVGIGEYDVTEASSVSPRGTGTGKIGQVVLAVVASRDCTRGYDVNNPTGTLNASLLTAIDKLHLYSNVHLADFDANSAAPHATPPSTSKMARPAVTDEYQIGSTSNSSQSVTPFNWPLGGSQYNFTKVIQIDPQGVARKQSASNADSIASYMEIDLQPTHANIAPAAPQSQDYGNLVALQLDCMTGATRVYHP